MAKWMRARLGRWKMEIEIMFKRNPHPLRFFQPPERLHFISNTCRSYFPPFIFWAKRKKSLACMNGQQNKKKRKMKNQENSSGKFSLGCVVERWERSEKQCFHVHFGFCFCLQHVHCMPCCLTSHSNGMTFHISGWIPNLNGIAQIAAWAWLKTTNNR